MRTLLTAHFFALVLSVCGQGLVHFRNDSTTLISANGLPMPVSSDQQFIFAMFLAPATTVSTSGVVPTYSDPAWQNIGGYNTNNSVVPGRINNRLGLDVGTPAGYSSGSTVDFLIRGWSVNAGATWAEALANWNDGSPLIPMTIGSSTVGNNLRLGDDLFIPTVFGSDADQALAFNMTFVPEPSTLALAGLGAVTMWFLRQRSA